MHIVSVMFGEHLELLGDMAERITFQHHWPSCTAGPTNSTAAM
ncbi:hypothetical protein [Haloactinomyces albus]|uniref:Uncharacterized protein n=1 Tax=Haloactinomyces albus TaxID=1352928 RepID=A0AAE3Z835_9ACTN|nr:hypothetical protein [Haloactinomyces albus]MDR7300063.1 hypothetical protein [Haloactinomyces albus]